MSGMKPAASLPARRRGRMPGCARLPADLARLDVRRFASGLLACCGARRRTATAGRRLSCSTCRWSPMSVLSRVRLAGPRDACATRCCPVRPRRHRRWPSRLAEARRVRLSPREALQRQRARRPRRARRSRLRGDSVRPTLAPRTRCAPGEPDRTRARCGCSSVPPPASSTR